MPNKKATEPIYLTPFAEAVSLGEVKLYHASMEKNMNCARAIDKAVNDCYKGDYIYDLKSAVQSVISEFGAERTKFVTALHLKRSSYDGRFSQENKAWAATLNVPHFDEFKHIHMNTHASILDGFTDHLRKITECQQKPKVGSYIIKKSVLFANNRGFAFAESKTAVSPFVTWRFKIDVETGEQDYYWGNYFSDKDSAITDYKQRVEKYKSDNNAEEVKETCTKSHRFEHSDDYIRRHRADILLHTAYEKYKKDWCAERGYDITHIDEEIGVNGECYVCIDEFRTNEFQDMECMSTLLDAGTFEEYKIIMKNEDNEL